MRYDFNADEVFAMAEQIEKNGGIFYRQAAAGMSDADAKAFLNDLAVMEDEHEKTFKAMRAALSAQEKAGTVFDPDNEAMMYLKALADTKVFFDKAIDTTTLKEILKAAITAEKDSIVFYLGMRDAVSAKLGKDKIDAIIKEEMGHIRQLSAKLVTLK
jgi:rubrerythrin